MESQRDEEDDGLRLIRKSALAERYGVSTWTIDRWVREGRLPKPVFVTPGSPAQWLMRDVKAHFDKLKRSRRPRRKAHGKLKQFRK